MDRTEYTRALAPMTRQEEKAELQYINDLFSKYIVKVRTTRQEATQGNSSSLLNSIKTLEGEIGVLKELYEKELDRIRGELQLLSAEKQRLEALAAKNGAQVEELQDKLTSETGRGAGLANELDNLRTLVAQKDLEISQLKAETGHLSQNLGDLSREYQSLLQHYEDLGGRYEKELLARTELEDKLANLQKKLEFNAQVNAEEVAELKSRLEVKGQKILQLEVKVRDMGQGDNTLHALLERVRTAADADLQKYKTESEAQYAKNLLELRAQMDQDAANIGRLSDENKKLSGTIDDYNREVNALRSRVRILEENNSDLISNLDQERQKSSVHIQGLEVKLKEMQETLIFKLKELGSGREPPIRAEIEALKALIADEENKLHVSSVVNIPGNNSTSVQISTRSIQQRALPSTYHTTSATMAMQTGKFANTTGLSTSLTSEAPVSQVKTPAARAVDQSHDYYASNRETVHFPKLYSKSDAALCSALTHNGPVRTTRFSLDSKEALYNQSNTSRLRVLPPSRSVTLS